MGVSRQGRRGVPLVYFDQSVWSSLGKASYSPNVSRRLRELADQGSFLMVLSEWHVAETVKFGGSRATVEERGLKLKHAGLISEFPNLIALRSTQDLLIQEIARAYACHLGVALAHDPPPFRRAGSVEDAIRQAIAVDAGYVPRTRREARLEDGARGSLGWWSWLDAQMTSPRAASYRAARADREYDRRGRTLGTGLKERLTFKPIVRLLQRVAGALQARNFALGCLIYRRATKGYLGWEPDLTNFFRWLWRLDFRGSPALVYRVAYERELDPSAERKPDVNDGRDAEHGFAAPFVDILVHESGHVEIARRAATQAGLKCAVFNGRAKTREIEKAVHAIETWNDA